MSKNESDSSWSPLQKRTHARNQKAKVMEVMESQYEPAISTIQITSECGLSDQTVRRYCKRLQEDGILERAKLNNGRQSNKEYWWIDL